MPMTNTAMTADTMTELIAACHALEDKKAEDLRILHLGERSSITDFYLIASGTSTPHLKALRNNLVQALKEKGITINAADDNAESGWLVIDAYDFMVHLFLPEQREHYGLEALWKDAETVATTQLEQQLQTA